MSAFERELEWRDHLRVFYAHLAIIDELFDERDLEAAIGRGP